MSVSLRRLFIVVFAVLGVLAVRPGASANPFDGRPSTPERQDVTTSNPWSNFLIDGQARASRAMTDALIELRDHASPAPVAIALGIAFLYGVFHAAGPGHGKTLVIGYFLARDARIGRGLLMGGQIALSHVMSAIVIVGALELLQRFIAPSFEDMRSLKLASYGAMAVIGAVLLRQAAKNGGHTHAACDHVGHGHGEHHHATQERDAAFDDAFAERHTARTRTVGAMLAGLVPCTGAILILLFALANNMFLIGLLMVLAIGFGMAITMGLLGMGAIFARARTLTWAAGSARETAFAQILAFAGPSLILLFGIGLFWVSL
jgi:nickel/cobalt exporter